MVAEKQEVKADVLPKVEAEKPVEEKQVAQEQGAGVEAEQAVEAHDSFLSKLVGAGEMLVGKAIDGAKLVYHNPGKTVAGLIAIGGSVFAVKKIGAKTIAQKVTAVGSAALAKSTTIAAAAWDFAKSHPIATTFTALGGTTLAALGAGAMMPGQGVVDEVADREGAAPQDKSVPQGKFSKKANRQRQMS